MFLFMLSLISDWVCGGEHLYEPSCVDGTKSLLATRLIQHNPIDGIGCIGVGEGDPTGRKTAGELPPAAY
jgi:hypothetical protein